MLRFEFVTISLFQVLISPLAPTPTPFLETARHGAVSPAYPALVRASSQYFRGGGWAHQLICGTLCKQWGGMCGHMEYCAVLTDWRESCSQKPISLSRKKAKQRNSANVHQGFSRWQKLKISDTTSHMLCASTRTVTSPWGTHCNCFSCRGISAVESVPWGFAERLELATMSSLVHFEKYYLTCLKWWL